MAFRALAVALRLLLSLQLIIIDRTAALAINGTIDDEYGDSVTAGALPVFYPSSRWAQGSQCKACYAQLNPQLVFDHTWHDATVESYDPLEELNITMIYTGTAVYAYCILDNNSSYTTFTNLSFSIDGALVGTFIHVPDSSANFIYNALVYANVSIPNGKHTFVIHIPRGALGSLVLFDYIIYTYDPDFRGPSPPSITNALTGKSSSALPIGAIVSSIVVGVVLLMLVSGCFVIRHRRRRDLNAVPTIPIKEDPRSPIIVSDRQEQQQPIIAAGLYHNSAPVPPVVESYNTRSSAAYQLSAGAEVPLTTVPLTTAASHLPPHQEMPIPSTTRHPEDEELQLLGRMYSLGVPTAEIARVMEAMRARG